MESFTGTAKPRVVLRHLVLAAAVSVTSVGCYHGSARSAEPGELTRARGWTMVDNVKLVRQTADRDCGAAALAMMLQHWSVPSSADDILRSVPVADGHGIAAGALRDFARQKGLRAFLIKGELTDLFTEIGMNRPVLVGLVQRYGDRALAHYEVVTGVNQTAHRLVLLDPGRGLREDGFEGFSTEWNGAGRLALVIVPS
jgi:ABC-type bacteriocin/lantibiotic exporter with double-glycine peptidase domain